MLNLREPGQLASALRTSLPELLSVLARADDFYEELVLSDPRRPEKRRVVLNARGKLRGLQKRFYEHVLLPNLDRSPYSHGGVRGRNILTNVGPHLGQTFIFTADVADFYPSVHWRKVLNLFIRLGCPPKVARLCTRLCTYQYHLAQGLVTSPLLADHLLKPVDERIGRACREHGLVYTRFVDDIAISGRFELAKSGFPGLVERVLRENGFVANPRKYQFGKASDGAAITHIRFPRGRPDVQRAYLEEVVRQIRDAASLGGGQEFAGPYYTEAQIWGRVRFIYWVNPRRRRELLAELSRVDWPKARAEAQRRGLEVVTKRLLRQSASTSRYPRHTHRSAYGSRDGRVSGARSPFRTP